VAGLEAPDRGRVVFEGQDITHLPPYRRKFGFMFQEFALFPHKSVFDNVAFGLEMQKQDPTAIRSKTAAMLERVGLADLSRRRVDDLSGGERQRVALARSLAPEPRLLMLDEPLGSLDRALRERLMLEIRDILKALGITALFVTHDQSEALTVADEIAVMNRGRIEQVDPPETLYMHPRTLFVARFLGFRNLLDGRSCTDGGIKTELGIFYPPNPPTIADLAVTLVIRPEAAHLAHFTDPGRPAFECKIDARLFTGLSYRITVTPPTGPNLIFDLPSDQRPPPVGETIRLALQPSKMTVINGDSLQR
jgi:ABC-type Fe3+/spermidine/putrescine transport system ATPase subunit